MVRFATWSSLGALLPLVGMAAAATLYACSSSEGSSPAPANDASVADTGTLPPAPVGTGDAEPVVTADASGDDDTSLPDADTTPPSDDDAGEDAGQDAAIADAAGDAGLDAGHDADADAAPAPTCVGVTGATVHADWTFAVSDPTNATLNHGTGQNLTVNRCDTVIWTNKDNGVPHSVENRPGQSFVFMTNTVTGTTAGAPLRGVQFTTSGLVMYECGVHGTSMVGQITVN